MSLVENLARLFRLRRSPVRETTPVPRVTTIEVAAQYLHDQVKLMVLERESEQGLRTINPEMPLREVFDLRARHQGFVIEARSIRNRLTEVFMRD